MKYNINKLKDVIGALNEVDVASNNIKEVDLSKQEDFVKDTFLHQDIKDNAGKVIITEEESAKLEIEKPEVFNYIRNFQEQIRNILKRNV